MRQNVIILTSGLTGSSVLTGLIARGGYWTGSTHQKEDYDTYENEELIRQNMMLFRAAGYTDNYLTHFSRQGIKQISSLSSSIDVRPYEEFVRICNQHRPWIWKDPRLWLTIRFWADLLDLNACRFIVLTRDYLQSWVSATLRRQIRSYSGLREYERNVKESMVQFLEDRKLPYLTLSYEELAARPDDTIQQLNQFLGSTLALDDLKKVYRKPLYRKPNRPTGDYFKAVLIYLKNYSERADARGR